MIWNKKGEHQAKVSSKVPISFRLSCNKIIVWKHHRKSTEQGWLSWKPEISVLAHGGKDTSSESITWSRGAEYPNLAGGCNMFASPAQILNDSPSTIHVTPLKALRISAV